MDYETILVEAADGLTTITLNRPEVMNALNVRMRAELTHALRAAGRTARVVVLTGAGRAFCTGQDLGDGRSAADLDVERTLRDEYVPLLPRSPTVRCRFWRRLGGRRPGLAAAWRWPAMW